MKNITLQVVKEGAESIDEALGLMEIAYAKSPVMSRDLECYQYSLVVPDEMADNMIQVISGKIDLRRRENMIVVSDVVASVSPYLDRLKEKSADGRGAVNPLEAIVEHVDRSLRPTRDMSIMVALASSIALIGLYLNNVVIIIGAMLLSPLLGPVNAVSVNTCLGKARRVLRAEATLMSMLGLAVGVSVLGSLLLDQIAGIPLTEEIMARSRISILDIALALLLGMGGGLALITALPELLVGVAIAVALIPPAAVTGIGVAIGRMDIFVGAFLLVVVSVLGLKIGGITTLLIRGVRPRRYYEQRKARRYSASMLLMIIGILALLLVIIANAGIVAY